MGDVVNFTGGASSGNSPTGGGYPPGIEARVAKVEATVEHIQRDTSDIKTDLRDLRKKVDTHLIILAGMIIAAFLMLGGMLVAGYLRISDRMDVVSNEARETSNLILQRLPSKLPTHKP